MLGPNEKTSSTALSPEDHPHHNTPRRKNQLTENDKCEWPSAMIRSNGAREPEAGAIMKKIGNQFGGRRPRAAAAQMAKLQSTANNQPAREQFKFGARGAGRSSAQDSIAPNWPLALFALNNNNNDDDDIPKQCHETVLTKSVTPQAHDHHQDLCRRRRHHHLDHHHNHRQFDHHHRPDRNGAHRSRAGPVSCDILGPDHSVLFGAVARRLIPSAVALVAVLGVVCIVGGLIPVTGAVDCFKCSSRNGSNPACEDPFHNLNTTRITSPILPDPQPSVIYHTPCYAGKKGRDGLFPASACIKLTGVFDTTGETLVVRHCALDSGTLTQDTELARMSHCGKFQFEGDLLRGCVLACPEDACNSARSLIHLPIMPLLFMWLAMALVIFVNNS